MSFLYPAVLWFLALLLIPIFIHLFNLRRYQKVLFSNVDFLSSIKSSTKSKLTIKQWLALISRLLALGFLILTFAVPFIKGDLSIDLSARQVIFLDNSYSNSNISQDGLSAFDNSSETVLNYLSQFNLEDKFYFATNDFLTRTSQSTDQVKDELSEVVLSADRRDLRAFIESYGDQVGVNYYLFSDFQRNQFDFQGIGADTTKNFYLFPAKYELSRNVYVDSVYLDSPVMNDAVENKLNVRLRNTGEEAVKDLPVFFNVNKAQVSSNTVDIEAGSFSDLVFDVSSLTDSINNCALTFEDFPVTFDNVFYFSVVKTRRIRVMEVADAGSHRYIQNVFDTELFDYSKSSISNLNYALIDNADFLILNGISNYEANFKSVIEGFLQSGGSILILPAKDANGSSFLSSITRGNVDFLAGSSSDAQALAPPTGANPFFSGIFEGNSAQIGEVSSSYLYNWRHGETLLKFRSGLPFLSTFRFAEGSVYLANSDLSSSHSGFAESSLFLPVMYKLAFSSLDSQRPTLYHRRDEQTVSWKGEVLGQDRVYRLKNGTSELIAPQRKLNGEILFDMSDLEIAPGFWSICDEAGACFGTIAINSAKEESEIDQFTVEELQTVADDNSNVFLLENDELQLTQNGGVNELGNKYFWKYTLLLALLFFFVEVLILRFL
ncbi:MAG: BatA domain-containing protein [Bacteroidota bacterium]